MIEGNGPAIFSYKCHTWNLDNYDVNLIKGENDLIWDVFCKITKSSSFFPFQVSSVPSLRCHPDTVTVIENIKRECFKDPRQILRLMEDFDVVRVVNMVTFEKEFEESNTTLFEKKLDDHIKDSFNKNKSWMLYNSWMTSAAVLYNSGVALSTGVTAYLGTGLIGSTASLVSLFALSQLAILGGALIPATYVGYNAYKGGCKLAHEFKNNIYSYQTPLLIEIEPKITAPSYIEPRAIISKFTWSVTLITGPEGTSKSHACIIVEGLVNEYFKPDLVDGEYFMHKSEFNPPVRSKLYSLEKFKRMAIGGIQKTETWMISSKKVESMLSLINQEKHLQEKKIEMGLKVELSLSGNKSALSNGHHSCFTWAKEKLEMVGVELIPKEFTPPSFLITKPKSYTESIEESQKKLFIVQI